MNHLRPACYFEKYILHRIAKLLFVTVALFGLSSPCQAALVSYEGFDYANGDGTNLTGLSGGTGWAGAWQGVGGGPGPGYATIESPGLSYPIGEIDGGIAATGKRHQHIQSGVFGASQRALSAAKGDSNFVSELWFTGLVQPGIDVVGAATVQPHLVTSGFSYGLHYSSGYGANWNLQLPGAVFIDTGHAFAGGQTIKFALRTEFSGDAGLDTISLWINPGTTFGIPNATGMANIGDVTDVILLMQNNGTVSYDELQLWDSEPGAVPEPSTYALAAIGLIALGLYGWRRRTR